MYATSGYVYEENRGLGTVPLTTAGSTAAGAAAGTAAAAGSGSIGASVLAAFGGPVGAAILGVTTLVSLWFGRKRPKQKEATTDIVNAAEPLLAKNLAAWYASSKTVADQQAALANFDIVWDGIVRDCGQSTMGDPGQWCINDRKPGGKWDWFARYRSPIANDPEVVPNPTFAESVLPSQITGMFSSGGGSMFLLLGIGLLGLGAYSMTKG